MGNSDHGYDAASVTGEMNVLSTVLSWLLSGQLLPEGHDTMVQGYTEPQKQTIVTL